MIRAADLGHKYLEVLRPFTDRSGYVPQRGDRRREWRGDLPDGVTWRQFVDRAVAAVWRCQREIAASWRDGRP